MPESQARIIDKYRVLRILGSGAMGAVYEVEHIYVRKRYALKLINKELAVNPEFRARALRESQASAAIQHENIVDVLDYGETKEGEPYIVMEFLKGRPLTDLIDDEAPMPVPETFRLVIEVLEGLAAAHRAGIIHRDVKPDNIFILEKSRPDHPKIKILDFGISKMRSTDANMGLTQTNAVMGTPYYMSLEQCRGSRDVDNRTDLFSIGVILYQMLTGILPFTGDSFAEIILAMAQDERPDLRKIAPHLSESVQDIVERAIAVDRSVRFASAQDMIEAMTRVLSDEKQLESAGGRHPDRRGRTAVAPSTHEGTKAYNSSSRTQGASQAAKALREADAADAESNRNATGAQGDDHSRDESDAQNGGAGPATTGPNRLESSPDQATAAVHLSETEVGTKPKLSASEFDDSDEVTETIAPEDLARKNRTKTRVLFIGGGVLLGLALVGGGLLIGRRGHKAATAQEHGAGHSAVPLHSRDAGAARPPAYSLDAQAPPPKMGMEAGKAGTANGTAVRKTADGGTNGMTQARLAPRTEARQHGDMDARKPHRARHPRHRGSRKSILRRLRSRPGF